MPYVSKCKLHPCSSQSTQHPGSVLGMHVAAVQHMHKAAAPRRAGGEHALESSGAMLHSAQTRLAHTHTQKLNSTCLHTHKLCLPTHTAAQLHTLEQPQHPDGNVSQPHTCTTWACDALCTLAQRWSVRLLLKQRGMVDLCCHMCRPLLQLPVDLSSAILLQRCSYSCLLTFPQQCSCSDVATAAC